MQITSVTPIVVGNPWKNWVFTKVETDAGIVGYGEATVGLNALPVEAAIREVADLCLGRDPRQISALWHHLHKAMYLTEGQIQHAAMAGIEIACWDILGKSLGVPVYELVGGRCRDTIRAYANGWYRGPRDPVSFGERALQVVEMGYTALKFDPFGAAFKTLSRPEERLAIKLVRAVRDAVGDDVDLIVEAHDRFSVGTAIRLCRLLDEFDLMWFEAPVLSSDIEDLVAVARASPVPIGVGERFTTQREVGQLLQHEIIDILLPETLDLGGFWPTREVAALANVHNALVAPHNARGPICTAVNCHLDLVMPNFLIQETFDDFNDDWTRSLVVGAPVVVDGYLQIGDGPGFGIELDEELAARHPYHPGNFMRLFDEGWEQRLGSRARAAGPGS